MTYAIAYLDRHGNERPHYGGKTFTSKARAEKAAKDMNAAIKVKGNGKYVVIEV